MYALAASHLKVHATLSRDLPMSKMFLRISFALGGILFLQLHGLADEQSLAL
jgi:hypothetical protein